jgi:uncharacterized protein with HEPN domain
MIKKSRPNQSRKWHLHAQHILTSIDRIAAYQMRGYIEIDTLVFDGTLRNLHTLSESTAHIPEEIKERYPEINWKAIIGFRNLIVHDYLGETIDIDRLKKVIDERLPQLKEVLEDILKQNSDGNVG